jgi:glutathione synthase/RimK-type ligase-like ATP-grasp enzyme
MSLLQLLFPFLIPSTTSRSDMIYMYAYSNASKTAKLLSEKLGIKRLKHKNSRAKPTVVINWGKGIPFPKVINDYKAVGRAINKYVAFKTLRESGVSVPAFTTSRQEATVWLESGRVVGRGTLTGHEGAGITIHSKGDALPQVPLYVKYIPKKKEFRVHIIGDKIVDVQQKVLKVGTPNPTFEIRNTANGFIFQRQGISVPPICTEQALLAVRALGLDVGAVDVIWNESQNKAYVLEVNTAPGLEGTSLEIYAKALRQLIKDKFNVG